MADFTQLKEWALSDWRAQRSFREDAEEEYNFINGHQWTDAERAELAEKQRVPIVFNRTAAVLSSVAGSEINNRTEVRFIPREIGDVKPNEILTAGATWFRDQANAEDEESQSFHDLLVCGIGWTETKLDFDKDPEGHPEIERISPLEMFWDCHAHRRGLTDAARVGRVHTISTTDAKDMFPGHTLTDIDADWMDKRDEASTEWNAAGDEYRDDTTGEENDKETVTVVQIQWRERERTVEYVDPATGQKAEMPQSKFDAISKRVPLNIPSRRLNRLVWRQAFLGRDDILKQNQPDPHGPTFKAMTGQWDIKDKRFFGLLRAMMDPQKYANKWLSQTLHIMNSNAKGGVMYETDAVPDPRQFEEDWAASDAAQPVNPGALAQGKIQPKPQAQMPSALMNLTEFAISSIRDVSGVSLELMGMREANQAGVLEYQRRQSSMTTLAGYFDSLRYYRKRQGETLLHFLREHIAPSGRLVRIVREDQVQYVPLAVDGDSRSYDVIVDDAPSAPNEKEKAWEVLQQMMPILQNAGLGMEDWAEVLEYSPLPSSFADKVREKAQAAKQQGPSPQEQLMMAELQKTQAEAQKIGAEAQAVGFDAQQAQTDMAMKQQEQQFKAQEHQFRQREAQMDMAESAIDIDAAREERAFQREKMAYDLEMARLRLAAQRQANQGIPRDGASPA